MHTDRCGNPDGCDAVHSSNVDYLDEDGPTYIPLIAPNGLSGTIDIASGALIIGGSIVQREPDLSYTENVQVVTGAGRLRNAIRRVVQAAPLRKLAGGFARVATMVAPLVPAPYKQALQGASSAASVVSRLGRGDPSVRAGVRELAQVAVDVSNPQSPRARAVLNQINEVAQGRVPALAARAFAGARAAENLAQRLASGDASAIASVTELVRNARTNPAAALSLNATRAAYRQLGRTSGFSENLERGAQLLWGAIRPRVGVRPTTDMDTPRDKYLRGIDVALGMGG